MSLDYKERQKILDNLKKQYNVDKVYSWSQLDTFHTDKWVYYLRYIKNVKPDNKTGAYALIGSAIHNLLQRFYEEGISNKYMVESLFEKYDELLLMGCKFDKNDEQRNKKIAEKYLKCCEHFLKNHKMVEGKVACETFIPVVLQNEKGDNIVLQTIIDFMSLKDDVVNIVDYKTSTMYSGKQKEENANQLKIYGLALLLTKNIPLEKIKLYWNFLKYVSVDCLQANGKWKTRHIERSELGNSLKTSVNMWARKLGYEEDEILEIENNLILNNSIDNLPKDIQEKFKISECLVEVDFKEEDVENLKKYILDTVNQIENLQFEYELLNDEKIYWQEVTPSDLYRLSNLCDYSPEVHLPYKEYLEKEKAKNYVNISVGITDDDLSNLFD